MKRFRIFVACTCDCQMERQIVHDLFEQDGSIRYLCSQKDVSPDVQDSGNVLPNIGRPQAQINAAMDTFDPDWVIFIFWRRVGTDAGRGLPGIQEEWERAKALNKGAKGRPVVSAYFKQADLPYDKTDGNQFEGLKNFRKRISDERQALVSTFVGPDEFRDQISKHFQQVVDRAGGTVLGQENVRRKYGDGGTE